MQIYKISLTPANSGCGIQDKLASEELAKGAPMNIPGFAVKTVLPSDGKGSGHMYSFDYAYKLPPVREWLFRQSEQR